MDEEEGRGNQARAKLCEAQALREQVVRGPVLRGQKLGPFLRGEGVALKNKLSCVNPKPCGSKSSEAQLCEARNWVHSLGGEGRGCGIEAQAKLCEAQSKSSEAQFCEARNWVRSLGERAWH